MNNVSQQRQKPLSRSFLGMFQGESSADQSIASSYPLTRGKTQSSKFTGAPSNTSTNSRYNKLSNDKDLDSSESKDSQQDKSLGEIIDEFNDQLETKQAIRNRSDLPKSHHEYENYLKRLCSCNQEAVKDTSFQEIVKPQLQEKKMRESFVNKLKQQNKIDSYQLSMQPILENRMAQKIYQNIDFSFHPTTQFMLERDAEESHDGITDDEQLSDNLRHSIVESEIDHYSLSENEQFLIVKTVEISKTSEKIIYSQFIRIFREYFHDSSNFTATKPRKTQKRNRYKEIFCSFVSDSGPLDIDKKHEFIKPTSLLFKGKYIFYFKKIIEENRIVNYVLLRLDLVKLELKAVEQYQIQADIDKVLHISFAIDGHDASRKLIFNKEDLNSQQDLLIPKFLNYQFLQIVDQDLDMVKLYSMKNLKEPISGGIKIDLKSQSFNCVFVIRKQQQKQAMGFRASLLENDRTSQSVKFVCIYDFSYLLISIENYLVLNISSLEYNVQQHKYIEEKFGIFRGINTAIRCLQTAQVLKYDPGAVQDESYEQLFHKKSQYVKGEYIKVFFLIDDQGKVQIIQTSLDMMGETLDDSANHGEKETLKILEFYQKQVSARNGLDITLEATQKGSGNLIKVTYIRDNLVYEDGRCPAAGLIEQFLHNEDHKDKQNNYIVAQNGSSQYLYIYDQQQKDISDFAISVVKIQNLRKINNQTAQNQQILSLLNQHDKEINQLRLNKLHNGVISTMQEIHHQGEDNKILIDNQNAIIIESASKKGQYFYVKAVDRKVLRNLEKRHKERVNNLEGIRFFLQVKSYSIHNDIYVFALELKVQYKEKREYSFVAENAVIKVSSEHIEKLEAAGGFLIGAESEIRLLEKVREGMLVGEKQELLDYNIFRSRFFGVDSEDQEVDYASLSIDTSQPQTILIFEQIVDSLVEQSYIPFIAVEKSIEQPLFISFKFQVLMFHNLVLTASKFINPGQADLITIPEDSCVGLWRSSDIYKIEDSWVAHYETSFMFEQGVERIQVQELKVRVGHDTTFEIDFVGVTEKLVSSIKTHNYWEGVKFHEERQRLLQSKAAEDEKEQDEWDVGVNPIQAELLKLMTQFRNPRRTNSYIAAKAVQIPFFEDNGYLKISKFFESIDFRRDHELKPVCQNYETPFLIFGYQKNNSKKDRSFDISYHSRLSLECMSQKIFKPYEVQILLRSSILKMMQMKHVCFQDFDFLLGHYSQHSFALKQQVSNNFFQPQEIFLGRTMCDIFLNDADQIQESLHKLEMTQKQKKPSRESSQLRSSTYDLLLQNNPQQLSIMQNSPLKVSPLRILSQDFLQKSQLSRCIELKTKNSYKLLVDFVMKANESSYTDILEQDLYLLMNQSSIAEILPFFQVSDAETLQAQQFDRETCNFESSIKGDLVPTAWTQDQCNQKIQIFEFDDENDQRGEIVRMLRDSVQEQETGGKKVEVVVKAVNFQGVEMGEKVKRVMAGEETKEFTNLELAQLMIQDDENKHLYELDTAQQIVDAQFDESRPFFLKMFTVYVLFFVVPILVSQVLDREADNQLLDFCLYLVALGALFTRLVVELIQMKAEGCSYFKSFWNFIDLSQIFVFAVMVQQKWPELHELTDEQEDHGDLEKISFILLKAVVVIQGFICILYYIRVFEDVGFMVKMVRETIYDLIPFSIFYFLWCLFFTTLYIVMEVQIEYTGLPGELKKGEVRTNNKPVLLGLNKQVAIFVYSFRNSMGDFMQPNYDNWLNRTGITDFERAAIIHTMWIIWHLQAIFSVIILLNFLIAVITQTYEKVSSKQTIYTYTNKAEMNLEYYQLQNQITTLVPLKYMLFVEPSNKYIQEAANDEWHGLVDAIRRYIDRKDTKIFKKIRTIQDDQEQTRDLNLKIAEKLAQYDEEITQIRQEQRRIIEVAETCLRNRSNN